MDKEQELNQREEERRQIREARERDKQEAREARARALEERRAQDAQDRETARQRQLGIGWIAFKAGFYGTLGVAVVSIILAVIAGIFWGSLIGAIFGMAS
jgi:hypothetical protein